MKVVVSVKLEQRQIAWLKEKGCNVSSVVRYLIDREMKKEV